MTPTTFLQWLTVTAIMIGSIWFATWVGSFAAKAEGDTERGWFMQRYRYCGGRAWDGSCAYYRYGYRRARNHVYHLPEPHPTRVYGYDRRHDDEHAGATNCRASVRATGDDKLTQDNAEVSAQDRWSIEVETHHGSKFSDVRYAASVRMTCVRKVPTSATEKGQAALGIRHHVCAMEGKPCSAPAVRQDDESRAKRRTEREEPTAPARRDR